MCYLALLASIGALLVSLGYTPSRMPKWLRRSGKFGKRVLGDAKEIPWPHGTYKPTVSSPSTKQGAKAPEQE